MSDLRYIAIEGPIGAGKTSLARQLAHDLSAQLILEEPGDNPFLSKFYEDRERYALSTQLAFLLARHGQQKQLFAQGAQEQPVISDYSFAKDLVFAELNLSPDELQLYKQLYTELVSGLPTPDLLVYLESDVGLLKKHVKKRKAVYEKKLKIDYLDEVLEAYKSYFFDYNETPLLVVNCSQIDFVNNGSHYQRLFDEIMNRKRGPRHYVALG